jgi:cytochrome c
MKRAIWMLAGGAAAVLLGAVATAQQAAPAAKSATAPSAAPLNGAELYTQKTCVACHGKDAKTPILPEYPKLAGQNEAYMLQQMKDIKSGARSNGNTAAMKGVMHLVNDDELKALAVYLASLK